MQSFEQRFFQRRQGRRQAALAQPDPPPQMESPGWLGGFVGSTASSFTELFGAEPTQVATEFRAENPLSGFATQMIGPVGAYGAMFRASRTARGAALLEGSMARIPGVRALNAVDNPLLYGAAREVVRYTPLELGRLGVGFAIADDADDYGEMLADVGLSTALTGGFGAIGGFFRAAGTRAPTQGRVIGADLAFRPTFEYRMSRVPGAQVGGDLPLTDVQNNLLREVFTELPYQSALPGARGRYVEALEGGTPETDTLINTLFRPSGQRNQSLVRQPLMDRQGRWALADDEMQELLGATRFGSVEEMAETMVTPRLITVNSQRAAGVLARTLDDSPALQYVGDGVMMAREVNSGLFVMAQRVRQGAATEGTERAAFGQMQIGEGDRWLVGLTDQPGRFLPRSHRMAEITVESWARYRGGFRPSRSDDMFNRNANMLIASLSVRDFRDIRHATKGSVVTNITERLATKFGEVTGLKGSERLRAMAEEFYGVVKPTVYLENQDPVFQRLFAHLRNNFRLADNVVNRAVYGAIKVKGNPLRRTNLQHGEGFEGHRPIQELWQELTPEERLLVARARDTRTPAEDLAKLSHNGLISERATQAVQALQSVDEALWQRALMPAFRAAGFEGRFDLLKGYIGPRVFHGDWFVPVVDEGGATRWLASGTVGGAKREAEAIVAEAAERGLNWKVDKPQARHVSQDMAGDIREISERVSQQTAVSDDTLEVVRGAMRRLDAAQAGKARGTATPGLPGTLTHRRTGIAGSPDIAEYGLDDIVKASEDHYRQLLRFAAYHTWRTRWMDEAFNLSKSNPTLYSALQSRANQLLGIESNFTNALNNTLSPVLWNSLGGKAATRIARGTNELMYNWNLAIANPTHALLNLLTPLQTVAPWVSFMTSKVPTAEKERLMHVMLQFDEAGRVSGTNSVVSVAKVMGRSIQEMRNPDELLMSHFSRGKMDGTLTPQLFEGFVGGQSRAHQTLRDAFHDAGGGVAGGWNFIKRTATFMAERSEEFSRIQAFTAAHIVGRDMFQLADDALYEFARRGTHVTMYGYHAVDRSRMFTGPIGSMAGLFKNWQFHFIGQMAQYAGIGLREGVWGPLLWQGGAALAVGGLGAVPLKMAADGLARWYGDAPSSFVWMQENWGDAADEIYFGLPALLGASLQASATIPGTDVRNDLANLGNVVFIDRARAAANALFAEGGAWDTYADTGRNPLQSPNVRDRMLQALAPRAFFRAFSATEGDYVRSMQTGYPQVRGLSPSAQLLQGLGLNQVEIERQQVAARELWGTQTRQRDLIQSWGVEFAEAMAAGDREEMTRITHQVVALGIPMSSVTRSAHTRMRRETESDSLSRFDAGSARRYIEALK